MSNNRRLDTDRLRADDKMLAELAESGSGERIHLDSWLNPSTSNTKSCCDRVPKKYFVGKGMISYRLKLPANSSAVLRFIKLILSINPFFCLAICASHRIGW